MTQARNCYANDNDTNKYPLQLNCSTFAYSNIATAKTHETNSVDTRIFNY